MAAKGKKKKKKNLIKLVSTESKHIYYTYKNPKNVEGKLELRRHDPIVRRHVKYLEKK